MREEELGRMGFGGIKGQEMISNVQTALEGGKKQGAKGRVPGASPIADFLT